MGNEYKVRKSTFNKGQPDEFDAFIVCVKTQKTRHWQVVGSYYDTYEQANTEGMALARARSAEQKRRNEVRDAKRAR
jgi:hypothetical protein